MMMGFTANIQSVHGNRKKSFHGTGINRFTETERELWRHSMTQEAEDGQNKGRAAGCGADDTPVLQEEGGQQGVMPGV